jgi:hypothetical protein
MAEQLKNLKKATAPDRELNKLSAPIKMINFNSFEAYALELQNYLTNKRDTHKKISDVTCPDKGLCTVHNYTAFRRFYTGETVPHIF